MSKDWIAYHNVNNTGTKYRSLGQSVLYTRAAGNSQAGDKIWIIEGDGDKSPKVFSLVDCFIVARVDDVLPPQYKMMKKRVVAKQSLMLEKKPILINALKDEELLEPLKKYLKTSPSMTGATDKLPALEALMDLAR